MKNFDAKILHEHRMLRVLFLLSTYSRRLHTPGRLPEGLITETRLSLYRAKFRVLTGILYRTLL